MPLRGRGGGRTPNGKCHLKFPFWLSAPFPKHLCCPTERSQWLFLWSAESWSFHQQPGVPPLVVPGSRRCPSSSGPLRLASSLLHSLYHHYHYHYKTPCWITSSASHHVLYLQGVSLGLQNHTWGGFQIELYNIHNIYNNIHFTHHPILSKKPCPVIAELLQYAPPGPGLPHWRPSFSSNSRLTLQRWQVGEFLLCQSICLFVCL